MAHAGGTDLRVRPAACGRWPGGLLRSWFKNYLYYGEAAGFVFAEEEQSPGGGDESAGDPLAVE